MKFREYIGVRLILAAITGFIMLSAIFFVLHILPGDPVIAMIGDRATPKQIEEVRRAWGLDKPLYIQYFNYITNLVKGDFGVSYVTKGSVIKRLAKSWGPTLELTIGAILISLLFGIPMGITSAIKKFSIVDKLIRSTSFFLYAIPSFWAGLILQLVFAVYIGIFPVTGRASATLSLTRITGIYVLDSLLTLNFNALVDTLTHLVLPSIALSIAWAPLFSELTRSALISELNEEYITTARAKGLSERLVVTKHALRNALLPVVTIIGLSFSGLLGGTIIIETIFGIPGLGMLLITALLSRDYPIIQGVLTIYCIAVIIIGVIIDILYGLIDPRVRLT